MFQRLPVSQSLAGYQGTSPEALKLFQRLPVSQSLAGWVEGDVRAFLFQRLPVSQSLAGALRAKPVYTSFAEAQIQNLCKVDTYPQAKWRGSEWL